MKKTTIKKISDRYEAIIVTENNCIKSKARPVNKNLAVMHTKHGVKEFDASSPAATWVDPSVYVDCIGDISGGRNVVD